MKRDTFDHIWGDCAPTYAQEQAYFAAKDKGYEDERNRRLVARDLDTTGDLFNQTEAANPLFATPTPKQ